MHDLHSQFGSPYLTVLKVVHPDSAVEKEVKAIFVLRRETTELVPKSDPSHVRFLLFVFKF